MEIGGDKRFAERFIAHAVMYIEKLGLSVFPVGSDKKPFWSWERYQTEFAGMEEVINWPIANLAVATGGLSGVIIVDCESAEDARWFYDSMGKTTAIVKTRRGFHLWFARPKDVEYLPNAQKICNRYDVRGDKGYALLPPSVFMNEDRTIGRYVWESPVDCRKLSISSLPVFRPEWRFVEKRPQQLPISNGGAYIKTIYAIAGQGGHDATWRAVNKLVEAGLQESEAFYEMLEWNKTNANPPWTEKELLHKVRDAYKRK